MSKNKTGKSDHIRPFLGLRSYEEEHKKWFGGRSREIERLLSLIEDNLLTILFGKSGIGKTSLIKAGLLPRIKKNFYWPIYIRIDFEPKAPLPLDQFKATIENQILQKDPKALKIGEMTVWEYLHEVEILGGIVQPVLFLDQFEELFTLADLNEPRIEEFLTELGDLAENRVPVKVQEVFKAQNRSINSSYSEAEFRVILSFREDYLANMENLRQLMPSIKSSRFRIREMDGENALNAILTSGKSIINEDNAREIIKKLPDTRAITTRTSVANDWKNKSIEPFMLSLVCYEINEQRLKKALPEITGSLIQKFNVQSIIKDHYTNNVINKYEPNVTIGIEELLVTSDGYRRFCIRNDFNEKFSVTDEQLDSLVDDRIIRQERRNGQDYVELIHDTMAPFITKSRYIRHEKEKRDKEKAEMRKKAVWYRVVAGVLLMGFLFSVFFGIKAKKAAVKAEGEQAKAEIAQKVTEDLKTALSDYSDSVSTAIAFFEDSLSKMNLLLKEARAREDQIVQQVSYNKLQSYNSTSYNAELEIADSLNDIKFDYMGALQHYQLALKYANDTDARSGIQSKINTVERNYKLNQQWGIHIYYLEEKRNSTVAKAKKVASILNNQGFKVTIISLTKEKNLRGSNVKKNVIGLDGGNKNEVEAGKKIKEALDKNGYNFSFERLDSKQKKPGFIFVYVYS